MAATYDQVVDALLDNADFEETGSVSKARAFITAATRFFILSPASSSDQGSSMAMGLPQIQSLMVRAQAYAAVNGTGSRVRFLSVNTGDFR